MKKCSLILIALFTVSLSWAQLSGTYYIGAPGTGPGGSDPEYATLKAACDAVMSNGVGGNITFYITSNLTEASAVHLGVNTAGFSITFKPSADENRTVTFTKTTDNAASSGGWVIGLSSDAWGALVVTDNIIIDGYADGGSTRRLTLETAASAHSAHTPIHLIGDVNNLTVKNCSLIVNQTTGTAAFGSVTMRVGRWSSVDYLVDNITVDNCVITTNTPSGGGIFISFTTSNGGATPVGRPTGLEFKNNIITVKHRAVSLNYAGTSSVYNNEISVNQPSTGFASFGIGGTSAGLVLTNVYNNKIIQLGTGNTGGVANGIRGIQASGGGTWNISNNFITGFSTPASGTTEVVGIRIGSASNVYYNTIVMNNVNTTGPGTTPTGCIVPYTTSCDIRNNILITEEDDFASYCIYASSLPATSNHNDLYRSGTTNAKIGYYLSAQATLADWQSASSKDANSVSKAVTFISSTDLHISGGSLGDNDLYAPIISGYTTDIDGDTRQWGYKGADERNDYPIPLTNWTVSMSASLTNAQAFGTTGLLGTDGSASFYAHWDATYLYLGWSGGKTNYSSDMYYAAIDTDPEGSNGITNAIEGVGFASGNPNPDYYVVYENNSSYYGVPVSEGNAFEIFNVSGGNWTWVSRTGGNDGTTSNVVFADASGEARLRIAWSTLGFTPGASNKLGIVMWNNNSDGNYMWARFPTSNPANGSTPITLNWELRFDNTSSGVNPRTGYSAVPLPVSLTSFYGEVRGNTVHLRWATSTETQNFGFEIERQRSAPSSQRSADWEKIGFVKGSGTSNSPKEYSFADNSALYGQYSYRLKQIDLDGSYSFSDAVNITVGSKPQVFDVKNFPNPFNPITTIRFELPKASKVKLSVYDITGQLIATLVDEYLEEGIYQRSFDGSRLASGIYISVLQAEGMNVTRKMQLVK